MGIKSKLKLINEDLKNLVDWSLADQAKIKGMSAEICALNQLNDRLTNRLFLLEEKVAALSFKEATPDPVYLSKINDQDSVFCFADAMTNINGE